MEGNGSSSPRKECIQHRRTFLMLLEINRSICVVVELHTLRANCYTPAQILTPCTTLWDFQLSVFEPVKQVHVKILIASVAQWKDIRLLCWNFGMVPGSDHCLYDLYIFVSEIGFFICIILLCVRVRTI